jgi:HAMP domain-containing protein
MVSNALFRAPEPKSRFAWQRLLGLVPVVVLGGCVGVLWMRLESQEAELRRARKELATAVRTVDMNGESVRIVRERVVPTVPQTSPARENATEVAPATEVMDTSEHDEPSAEERAQAARARFAHIQGIFTAQKASDFEPDRARTLEREVSPALAELPKQRNSIELGSIECRGRMCGVDVALDGPADADLLDRTVRTALIGHQGDLPLIHLVLYVGDRPDKQVGRLYFEWLPADANERAP